MMELMEMVRRDLSVMVADKQTGFGEEATFTSPEGTEIPAIVLSSDISQVIDPDTGQLVSGRKATVAVYLKTFDDANVSRPRGVADENSKPWLVRMKNYKGDVHLFKIVQTHADRGLGLLTCSLESYAE